MPTTPKRSKAVMIRLDEEQAATLEELAKLTGIPGATHAHRALVALLEFFRENPDAFRPVKFAITREYTQRTQRDFLLNEPPAPEPAKHHGKRAS